MREALWLQLRSSPFLRKIYGMPSAAGLMRALSYMLVPFDGKRKLRVRTGPGQGLVFELNPRWETQVWEGRYEITVQTAILEKLRFGGVFYDVGAGFGFYSLLASRAGAQVFAFEPDVRNAEALERHATWNSLYGKIEIIRAAVLSKSGYAELEAAGHKSGHGDAHVLEGVGAGHQTVRILCGTLNDFDRVGHSPDVIKIDVERSKSAEGFRSAFQALPTRGHLPGSRRHDCFHCYGMAGVSTLWIELGRWLCGLPPAFNVPLPRYFLFSSNSVRNRSFHPLEK